MPSDWIKGKADDENRRNEENRQRELKRERDDELIRALGPQLVKQLRKVIDDDVVAWNANFKDRIINGTGDIPNGFSVDKVGFPRGSAQVTFNPATSRIEIELTRSVMAGPDKTYETKGYVYLRANPDGGNIHMEDRMRNEHLQPAGFSRIILESIADQQSNHII
jgi:hypothetical protein